MSLPFSSARSSVSSSSSGRSSLLSSISLFSSRSNTSSLSSSSSIITTSSTQSTATHLTFLAFPPSNVPATTLETISHQTALRLLHDHKAYLTLNPAITACHEIPSASQEAAKLDLRFQQQPTDLCPMPTSPNTEPWRFYLLTCVLPLPLLSTLKTTTYLAAARTTAAGLETLVQAPGHATLRSVAQIEARREEGPGFRESLWLVDEVEVRCRKGMRWYVETVERERRDGVHEMFRVAWDERVRRAVEGWGGTTWERDGMGRSEDRDRR